jgi:hypothetical protein
MAHGLVIAATGTAPDFFPPIAGAPAADPPALRRLGSLADIPACGAWGLTSASPNKPEENGERISAQRPQS